MASVLYFLPNSGCSLKKKKGLHFDFLSNFFIFLPKIEVFSKKKRFCTQQRLYCNSYPGEQKTVVREPNFCSNTGSSLT